MAKQFNNVLWTLQGEYTAEIWFNPIEIEPEGDKTVDFRGTGLILDFPDLEPICLGDVFYHVQEELGEKYQGALYVDTEKIELGLVKILLNPTLLTDKMPSPAAILAKTANAVVDVIGRYYV